MATAAPGREPSDHPGTGAKARRPPGESPMATAAPGREPDSHGVTGREPDGRCSTGVRSRWPPRHRGESPTATAAAPARPAPPRHPGPSPPPARWGQRVLRMPPGSPAAPLPPRLCRRRRASTGTPVPHAAPASLGLMLAVLPGAPSGMPAGMQLPRRSRHRGTVSAAARCAAADEAGCGQPRSCPSVARGSVVPRRLRGGTAGCPPPLRCRPRGQRHPPGPNTTRAPGSVLPAPVTPGTARPPRPRDGRWTEGRTRVGGSCGTGDGVSSLV